MHVKVFQNVPGEHSAILSTFIKLPFVLQTFVLSIFEWPLKTGFTVILLFIYLDYVKDPIVQAHAKFQRNAYKIVGGADTILAV